MSLIQPYKDRLTSYEQKYVCYSRQFPLCLHRGVLIGSISEPHPCMSGLIYEQFGAHLAHIQNKQFWTYLKYMYTHPSLYSLSLKEVKVKECVHVPHGWLYVIRAESAVHLQPGLLPSRLHLLTHFNNKEVLQQCDVKTNNKWLTFLLYSLPKWFLCHFILDYPYHTTTVLWPSATRHTTSFSQ